MEKNSNSLINASSPYLLQHAYNPVNWQEWGPIPLAQARDENKLIIVSIGYSACHWCHVMEHESFENFEVAEVMNRNFVCIKIDREERPDIDQIYMLAVQLMGQNGGWPLNCICLPDQRPIYGGTYFRKNDWISLLESIAQYWQNEPGHAREYAERLAEGISMAEKIVPDPSKGEYGRPDIEDILKPWKRTFDMQEGGYNRAPKFPLPNNWQFLLRAGYLLNDDGATTATLHTLEKMAMGGIYDQAGGGFARYSVDDRWHVPHFEKMLYDNAQLISLYLEAYQFTNFSLFREVAEESMAWINREMTSPEGLFYSALDADSEGIEGKFYVWSKAELISVLGADADLMIKYFNVTEAGNWEEEHTNILLRKYDDEHFAGLESIALETLKEKIELTRSVLLRERSSRVRPALDDKCLTSWNAMMIRSFAEAGMILNNKGYYETASRAMLFILQNLKTPEGGLYRNYKNGIASITGFLDDYAFTINALTGLYQADFNESWLLEAKKLTDHVLEHFTDPGSPMLYYTSNTSEKLIARKHEIMDNVIPSANSVMAQNLQALGLLFGEERYSERALAMLSAVHAQVKKHGSSHSNWGIQMLSQVFGLNEVVFSGREHVAMKKEFLTHYIPNKIMLGGTKGTLPLLENKPLEESKIYICRNKTCSLPVDSVAAALELIQ